MAVGYHFFQEGKKKINSGNFSSVPVFATANGDFAGFYRSLAGDTQGFFRLGYDESQDGRNKINPNSTFVIWDQFGADIQAHYGFGDEALENEIIKRRTETKARIQKAVSQGEEPSVEDRSSYTEDERSILAIRHDQREITKIVERHKKGLEAFLAGNEEDINNYFLGVQERLKGFARDGTNRERVIQEVDSLSGQASTIKGDLAKDRAPWLGTVNGSWDALEEELNALAVDRQKNFGYFPLTRPYEKSAVLGVVDRVIPWFDLTVGILLIFGLFSRFASLAGAALLLGVIGTQVPWAPGSVDTYYQVIEMFALLVLAGTWAGYYAGLDFFVFRLRARLFGPKETEFDE